MTEHENTAGAEPEVAPEPRRLEDTPEGVQPPHDTRVQEEQIEVGIQRSVRFGRLLIVGAFIGAALAVMITLMFPVLPEELYEMRQIAGFMLVVGGAIGLLCGALLGLILNVFAKRRSGTGVALHTDVQ